MPTPHPSEARYRRILQTQREGETLVALARRHRVKLRTLYWWHQRLARRARDETRQRTETTQLIEVQAPSGPLAGSIDLSSLLSSSFEVALRGSDTDGTPGATGGGRSGKRRLLAAPAKRDAGFDRSAVPRLVQPPRASATAWTNARALPARSC